MTAISLSPGAMMEKTRLDNWYAGELEDDELTDKEVKWLERAVFDAIVRKTLENPGVHTFPLSKEIH